MIDWTLLARTIPVVSSIYDRTIKQPDLSVEIRNVETFSSGESINVIPHLVLLNDGRAPAKEAHIEMALPKWDFEQDDPSKYPESSWRVRYERTGYYTHPGHLHKIDFEDTIPPKTPADVFLGRLSFEKNSTYVLEYEVRCTSHQPRKGRILFNTGDRDLAIEDRKPSFLRELRGSASNWVKSLHQDHDSVHVATDFAVERDEEYGQTQLIVSAAIRNNTGTYLNQLTANISIERDGGVSSDESSLTEDRADAIAPGEQWILRKRFTIQNLDVDEEQWNPKIGVEYEPTKSWIPPRGVETSETEKRTPANESDPSPAPHITGTIKNTNQETSVTFWVFYRFKSGENDIIETKRELKSLGPQSCYNFSHYASNSDPSLQQDVTDIEVLLMES